MAETYPNPNSEPDSHGNKHDSGKSEKNAPGSIKKVGGVTPMVFGDRILLARSIDSSLFQKPERHEPKPAEAHKQPDIPEREHGERENWHPVSAQELHKRAIADQQARFEDMYMQEHAAEAGKDPAVEDEAKKAKKRAVEDPGVELPKTVSEQGQPESVEDILFPQDAETSGKHSDQTPSEATSKIGPDVERNSNQPTGTEAAFQSIAQAPELADLAAVELPETAASDERSEAQPASDDDTFRDMIANETGEDPGETQLHEQEPGMPPVEASDSEPESFSQWLQGHPELAPLANTTNAAMNSAPGHNGAPNPPSAGSPHGFNPNAPNQPPFGNGNGGNQPPGGPGNPNAGAWNNGPNVPPNPNVLNNPWAPAGSILNPAVLAGMSVLEARRQLDSLRHTAREAGLAGAVGILGLGLVIEHFRTSKTRRMLKKQGKEQARALSKTNRELQQERYAHQATQAKLEHLGAAHHATDEQLRRTTATLHAAEHAPAGSLADTEKAVGVGLISAAAAAELAANAGKAHGRLTNEQLAKQLEHNKELGRAIKRNPELRDIAGLASTTAAEQREFNEEVRDAAEASAAADVLTEKRYEQLQVRGSRNGGGTQSGGADVRSAPNLPTPQQPSGSLSTLTAPQQRAQQSKAGRTNVAANPVAWATVVIIIAIIVIAVVVH